MFLFLKCRIFVLFAAIIFLLIVILIIFSISLSQKNRAVKKNVSGIENGLFLTERQKRINVWKNERREQLAAAKYVDEDANVLELGGRYGTVSCVISKKIKKKRGRLVIVEPDITVQKILIQNLQRNNCHGIIIDKVIGDKPKKRRGYGYGTRMAAASSAESEVVVQSINIKQLQKDIEIVFDTLVADCEGCLEEFIQHCITYNVLHQFHTLIYERDKKDICNYEWIEKQIVQRMPHMIKIQNGFVVVWKRKKNEKKRE